MILIQVHQVKIKRILFNELIVFNKVKVGINPWPQIDVPWGLTSAFFETEARFHNQNGPIINMISGIKRKLIISTPYGAILSLAHMYDVFGNELMLDKGRDVQYTVLLNKKNPIPSATMEDDEVFFKFFIVLIRALSAPTSPGCPPYLFIKLSFMQ